MDLFSNMLKFCMEKAKEIFDSLYAQAVPLGIKIKYIAIEVWIGLKFFAIEFVNTLKSMF